MIKRRIADMVYRVRYHVLGANPVNYTVEAAKIVEMIKGYNID
jgi:hypothetical protein